MSVDISLESRQSHLDIVARTDLVSVPVMMELIDVIANAVRNGAQNRVLLEVIAARCRVMFIDHVEIWNYALRKGLRGLRIAHVISGRTVDENQTFKEDYAYNRGIPLRTFTKRSDALAWLMNCEPVPAWQQ